MSEQTWNHVDQHFLQALLPLDPIMDQVLQNAVDAELPAINIEANQGAFLQFLARMCGAKRILELGTLGGFSTVWMARGLPADGTLVTLELEQTCAEVAQRNFALAGVEDQVDLRLGPAAETLRAMIAAGEAPFDFVFFDADKEGYPEYLELTMQLVHPGSVLVADNVVRQAEILDPNSEDPSVQGTQAFLQKLGEDPRLDATALQTVGAKGYDGFALALVR
ncbi:MAG: O-methyltransferase [Planctomycetota bacterium]